MNKFFIYIAMTGIMLQAGCSVLQVQHEESTLPFGHSTRLAVKQQILDPNAGGDAPVVGLDGRYAAKVVEKRHDGPVTKAEDGMSISEVVIGAK